MSNHEFHQTSCIDYLNQLESESGQLKSFAMCIADPPYSEFPLIRDAVDIIRKHTQGTVCMFMYFRDLPLICADGDVSRAPQDVIYWENTPSPKNTINNYGKAAEPIALWNIQMSNKGIGKNGNAEAHTHWINRCGKFTDHLLFKKRRHEYEKPESLIERLIENHYPGQGTILDPFAGSRTVERVCRRLGIDSVSIDIEDHLAEC